LLSFLKKDVRDYNAKDWATLVTIFFTALTLCTLWAQSLFNVYNQAYELQYVPMGFFQVFILMFFLAFLPVKWLIFIVLSLLQLWAWFAL